MIGDNLDSRIRSADDARAFAAAIAALRAEADRITAEYKPHLDELEAEATEYRGERDDKIAPREAQTRALREVLADWLAGDPDGNLRDGDRIVATLSRKPGKLQIHAEQVPDAYKSMQPDMGKINLALASGEKVPGVSVPVTAILRVL